MQSDRQGSSCRLQSEFDFLRFNGHSYDVDDGVRDEQREEKVWTAVPGGGQTADCGIGGGRSNRCRAVARV